MFPITTAAARGIGGGEGTGQCMQSVDETNVH